MKSLTVLWKIVAEEFATRCCTSATMDIKTVQGRFEHEGMSFLTITLPSFGSDFQKSLDQGIVARNTFEGFKFLNHGELPVFLQGFLELVFDRASGVLLEKPNIEAVLAVRQLTLMFSKILLPCSDARIKDSMSAYVQCDQEVKLNDSNLDLTSRLDFRRMSSILFRELFTSIDRSVYYEEHVPKHGPGATADKLRGNAKFNQRDWPVRLEDYFHSGNFLFSSPSHFAENYDDIRFLEPGAEIPVKVITVPKTMKTPRIIAIEPTAMQYAQQSILEQFVHGIERSYLSDLIGFVSQEPNQLLAQQGSLSGSLATLDLSEASDRVSNQLVRDMLVNHPHLLGAVESCRSRKADVPGHGVIRLAKFASMGSALCFPMEAMVFCTLVFLGIEKAIGHRFTNQRDIKRYIGSVRIYGDDIIIPTDVVHSVVNALEHFGARVGAGKSFWIGRFRESCGKEYYDGHDVSVVKVRRVFPTTRKHVPEVISIVSLRNQFYEAGVWSAVKWLDSRILKVLKYFPYVEPSSSVLGRVSFLGYQTEKVCEHLHAPLVRGYVVSSRLPSDPLDGAGALLKWFLKRGNLPIADRKHLERAGRPRSVNIKARWASPF